MYYYANWTILVNLTKEGWIKGKLRCFHKRVSFRVILPRDQCHTPPGPVPYSPGTSAILPRDQCHTSLGPMSYSPGTSTILPRDQCHTPPGPVPYSPGTSAILPRLPTQTPLWLDSPIRNMARPDQTGSDIIHPPLPETTNAGSTHPTGMLSCISVSH